jgi:hypothetical protein
MNRSKVIGELRNNRKIFADLFSAVSQQDMLYRSAPEKWNLLEIVCHLFDEECLDFRARMLHILQKPGEDMPSIDPQGWVKAHKYSEKDFPIVTEQFLTERDRSLEWLETLADEDLKKHFDHPVLGRVDAGYFLMNWLAHDYLHIRQIISLKYSFLKNQSGADLRYAGDW